MEGMEALEEMMAAQKPSRLKRLLKDTKLVRKGWNGVNPVTKVDKVRTKYDRKRHKRIPLSQED